MVTAASHPAKPTVSGRFRCILPIGAAAPGSVKTQVRTPAPSIGEFRPRPWAAAAGQIAAFQEGSPHCKLRTVNILHEQPWVHPSLVVRHALSVFCLYMPCQSFNAHFCRIKVFSNNNAFNRIQIEIYPVMDSGYPPPWDQRVRTEPIIKLSK